MGTCANYQTSGPTPPATGLIKKGNRRYTGGCNRCNNCNTCNVGVNGSPTAPKCNNKQTVCTDSPGKGQLAKSYKPSGAPNVTAGKTIKKQFNRDDMNNLIDWIKEMAKLGVKLPLRHQVSLTKREIF